MSAEKDQAEQGDAVIKCRRTGQTYDLSMCPRCPYCFGDSADVESTDPESFCDFHPGEDPVSFGFPRNDVRMQRG
ncbi:MAG: hypothetical protein QF404_08205 [Planctomycetota bacterium]|jgi:hypothetical protein|nr:hypothetical protein [Planctomycetota bacterium]MDP6940222.1 hypothetical protein [Planctomycetota bacterium]